MDGGGRSSMDIIMVPQLDSNQYFRFHHSRDRCLNRLDDFG